MKSASGCEQQKIFENQHLAVSGQGSAKTAAFATLCRLGLGLGLGLGDPWVTQASPKGHARITQASIGESLLFATRVEKEGWGWEVWLKDAGRGTQSGLRQFRSFIRGKSRPLFQDDRLRRGDFAPRSLLDRRDRA
jgi:hypothetical protein